MRFSLETRSKVLELIADISNAEDETKAVVAYRFATEPGWGVTRRDDHDEDGWEYLEYQADLDALARLKAYLCWYYDPSRCERPVCGGE